MWGEYHKRTDRRQVQRPREETKNVLGRRTEGHGRQAGRPRGRTEERPLTLMFTSALARCDVPAEIVPTQDVGIGERRWNLA
ncbi:hypothetical protein Trydic_g2982 [Trypoxylus dichotomus]